MATSGTTGQTTMEVAEILTSALRRCGLLPSALTPETIALLKTNLWMLLANIRGINLWRIKRQLQGVYPNQAEYTLDAGTLDVTDILWRNPTRLGGTVATSAGGTIANLTDGDTATVTTQAGANGNFSWDFGADTTVNLVGLLSASTVTLTLTFETSPDNAVWTSIEAPGAVAYTDGVWRWYEIDPARAARYFRVRASGGGTLSFREIFVCQQWYETNMYRMNRDEYAQLPQKRSSNSDVFQYWLNRQLTPVAVLWPVPSTTFRLMNVFAHMQVEDVGALSNTLDIPSRWHETIVSNLAFMSILDIPGADLKRYDSVKDQAATSMKFAEAEERDASPTNITPGIGAYTA